MTTVTSRKVSDLRGQAQVERSFGFATAHAYAGHTDTRDDATSTYVRADITDVATALATLTGEPHPLATRP